MFATVRQTHLKPGKLEEFVKFWHEESRPILETWPGLTHSYLLTDTAKNTAVSVTLWESEEAARADPPADVAAKYQTADTDIRSLIADEGHVDYCQVSGHLQV